MDKISSVKRTYSQVFNNDGSNQQNRQVISNSGIKKSKLGTGSSMCGQSEKDTVSASGFTQQHEAYNSATKIQSFTRGHLERKSIKQQNNAATKIQSAYRDYMARNILAIQSNQIPVEFTQTQDAVSAFKELPDDMINTVCSFLTLKDRLSLKLVSKRFSPLEISQIQTQSLGTDALRQLAKKEATPWINEQLQSLKESAPWINETQLIRKICKGEIIIPGNIVKTTVFTILFERDANLDEKDFRELIALHVSAEYGNVNAIRVLKELGVNINTPDTGNGETPVYRAALEGQACAIRVLKKLGADVNTPNSDGVTPVNIAAAAGKVEAIRALAENGAHVNTPSNNGTTPLWYAIQWGDMDAIRVLTEKGADVNTQSNNYYNYFGIFIHGQNGRDKYVTLV